ncbi:DUF2141 domain-containing protein [Bacteroides sp. UBA939]|uniref:DUF2141 domain-containing protein n=1 Tax=Bacteroides sp. UBA939 TaxID=1946092 RepID=UPI0025BEDDCC|nr:DUF2141 domain-containing protein [Bacteroides sp. UBA939]
MKAIIISFVFALTFVAQSLSAQNLTLEVRGIENVTGKLYVAIYNSPETFMKKPLAAFAVEVKDNVLSLPCKGLPAGTYAFSLYQDENGNGKLDTATFGIPTEKYGFSNDAKVVMGPPSYEKCSITFSEDTTLVVNLQ